MSLWDFLIDETVFETAFLSAGDGARFARPVREGLQCFLEGLPAERQAVLIGQQAKLPASTPWPQRMALLAAGSPVLQKLGQVVARDARLAAPLRYELQGLESLPPTVPLEIIQATLAHELGPLDRLGLTLTPPALAEASVAVVIPFQETQGADGRPPRRGVFKVLKPGIEEQLEQELALLERVGEHLDTSCDRLRLPHLDYQDAFAQVREKLLVEVQLDQEQQHLARARKLYAQDADVLIPELFDFGSRRVTAMERIDGDKVTLGHRMSVGDRQRLASLVIRALLAKPCFTNTSSAMFHADPHAGNLLRTMDNRLAILDWSLVGELTQSERTAIVELLLACVALDTDRITRLLLAMAQRGGVDHDRLRAIVQAGLRRIRRGSLPGVHWLTVVLDEGVMTAGLRLSPHLMLFRKTLHTLSGVLETLGAGTSQVDGLLAGVFLCHVWREWPSRWWVAADCRDFASGVSNADLARVVAAMPWSAARYWMDQTCDALKWLTDRGVGRYVAHH